MGEISDKVDSITAKNSNSDLDVRKSNASTSADGFSHREYSHGEINMQSTTSTKYDDMNCESIHTTTVKANNEIVFDYEKRGDRESVSKYSFGNWEKIVEDLSRSNKR